MRWLDMLSTHHVVETSIEHRVRQMSVEERIARVAELRQRALHIYLPMYRARGDAEGAEQQNQLANGRPTIAWTATAVVDAANDNDECVAIGEVLQREDLDGGVATANAVEQQIELSG